jgi:hypothetical protein
VAGPWRSAYDLELILRAIAGPDAAEFPAWQLDLPPCDHARLADFRVAVLPTHPLAEVDATVSGAIEGLGHWLAGRARGRLERPPRLRRRALWRTYVLLLRATTSLYMDDAAFADALAKAGDAGRRRLRHAAVHWRHAESSRLAIAAARARPVRGRVGADSSPTTTCCCARRPPPRRSRSTRPANRGSGRST